MWVPRHVRPLAGTEPFQAAEEQICDLRTFCDSNPLTVRRFMKDKREKHIVNRKWQIKKRKEGEEH